jgi:hypothetical protein
VVALLPGKTEKLTAEQRVHLVRNLTAEFGTAKVLIPRSKKPLEISAHGQYDKEAWAFSMSKFGPAARLGDLVQITKIEFESNKLIIELNHGLSGGRKWWHRIQVSGSTNQNSTLGANQATHAPGGTKIALIYEEAKPPTTSDEFKEMMKSVLDFEQRSATELYLDKIDVKFREAIEKKEVIEGMDREMVLLSQGRPVHKVRDFKAGVETEDWIYGEPPGDIIFVTFEDGEVIRIKEAYAALGGQVRETPQLER